MFPLKFEICRSFHKPSETDTDLWTFPWITILNKFSFSAKFFFLFPLEVLFYINIRSIFLYYEGLSRPRFGKDFRQHIRQKAANS